MWLLRKYQELGLVLAFRIFFRFQLGAFMDLLFLKYQKFTRGEVFIYQQWELFLLLHLFYILYEEESGVTSKCQLLSFVTVVMLVKWVKPHSQPMLQEANPIRNNKLNFFCFIHKEYWFSFSLSLEPYYVIPMVFYPWPYFLQ